MNSKRLFRRPMSAIGTKADIAIGVVNVRFGSMLSIKALREAPNGDSVC
jgi:hypothetical protein